MSFATVEHLGNAIALLLIAPNLRDENSLRIRYSFPARVDEGESGRETRTPERESLNLEQTCRYTLRKSDAAALKAGLAALGNKIVGVPLWCDILTGADWADRIHTPGYLVRISNGQILAQGAELIAGEQYAPLLVGRLRQRPDEVAWSEDGCECEIAVFESSDPVYKITGADAGVANTWPAALEPQWTEVIERSKDGLVYDQVGKIREISTDGQETATKWGQEAEFLLTDRDEIRTLIGFFEAARGRWKSFDAPVWFKPNEDEPATPHETVARLAADAMELSFAGGSLASVRLALWQVPWEIEGVDGEEPEQPAEAYLYRCKLKVPGSPIVWRFTDWERELVRVDDGTYAPAPIEHDRITQDFALDDQPTRISSRVFEGNPLMLVISRMLEAPLEVEIFRCDPTAVAGAVLVYSGEIEDVEGEGRALAANTSVLGGALEIKVPGFNVQVPCNHDFCDAECTLEEEDWTFSGTVSSIDGVELVVTVTVNPPAAALVEDYFAKAWITKGEGAGYEARDIVRSYVDGALQRFILKRAFRVLEVGDTVSFRPNCGGTWAECKEKFGNQINYGGHRHVKADSPSLPSRETNQAAGKK